MAMLNQCSCSNQECSRAYSFISGDGGVALGKETYLSYHEKITHDISVGKYGTEVQCAMKSPDSVFLKRRIEYTYCPHCDEVRSGGRIEVYIHKEGHRAELEYDDWDGTYYLAGFNPLQDYEEILTVPVPCGKCGGALVFFDRYEKMACPSCGSPMQYGRASNSKTENRKIPEIICAEQADEEDTELSLVLEELSVLLDDSRDSDMDADDDLDIPEYLFETYAPDIPKGKSVLDAIIRYAPKECFSDLFEEDTDLSELFEEDTDFPDFSVEEPEVPVLLTEESIAAYHGCDPEDVRIGETPDGGVYSIVTRIGNRVYISEFNEDHEEIMHTSGFITSRDPMCDSDD